MLALPLVSTLYQYGRFTVTDVMQTRLALLGYSVGLPALILVKILAPGFYARQVMGTPVKIAFFTVLITQTLAVLFAWPLGLEQAGLTLATSIGAFFNAGLLLLLLLRRGYYRPQPGWPVFLAKVAVAVMLLAIVVGLTMGVGATWLTAGVVHKVEPARARHRRGRRRVFRNALRAGVSPRAVQSSRCDRSAGRRSRRRRGTVTRPRVTSVRIAGLAVRTARLRAIGIQIQRVLADLETRSFATFICRFSISAS